MTGAHGEAPPFYDVLRKRAPVLEALADGPLTQRALRDALGVSRSTVYKALQDLEAAGLVAPCEAGYRLTGLGRLAWRRHDAYLSRLDRLAAAGRLLETVPPDHHLPLRLFEHGRVHVPGRHAPERPLDRLEERAKGAERLRCLSPSGMPRYFEKIHERVLDGQQTATLVLEPPATDRLESDYDDYETASREPNMEIRAVDGEIPFALVLFDDDELGFFGYEEGVLVGAVFADDASVLRWGRRVFERYRDRSEPT
ncbi:helix-turn-helix transcriptional regulator [Natronomonas marina]|jgi:predicted transcriptional regulator|uniref:helix-turn-helix transcriptional regulator n=1 Tax=Natronomonas marina TaxID=2961939 RepID=UPI0020C9D980|nr:MarR family transcriptional regulator [Natronomonas marina]